MQFLHQPLTWGFLLVLLPLLIHLINMVRRHRVQWAAMDFLLQSYRKHRKWIWLKQFLLLLMRMAVVAILVAMLAQWVSRGQWLDLFGGTPTHHYVLLDDSYSMAERHGGASAFETGLAAIGRIGSGATDQPSRQKFTLIRFSKAARLLPQTDEAADFGQLTDFNAAIIDADFDLRLEEKRNAFQPTQLAVGPQAALAVLNQLVDRTGDEHRIVYVVSDFRENQWGNPAEMRTILREVEKSPAEIHLVDCTRAPRQNLGLVELAAAAETRAAGVPLFVNVAVKNYSDQPARNVQLKVQSIFFDDDLANRVSPDQMRGEVEELPTVLIEQIEPGEVVTRRVQVYFSKPGRHVVEAILPDDVLEADNRRWTVIDFPASEPVLLVDGSTNQQHAYFLESVFNPGERANTGIATTIETAAFLRDVTPEVLARYRVIYLLDVPRLDDRAIENLEAYVRGGGGLCVFVGPNVNRDFYHQQLYADDRGLLPMPLGGEALLPPQAEELTADIEVEDHPVFNVFLGERNSLIRLVTVEQYLEPAEAWRPAADAGVEVIARLRNKAPLAVERKLGDGHVILVTTTLAPLWNNWGRDPTFVVVALKLQSYLASAVRDEPVHPLGAPIAVPLEVDKYRQDLLFVTPGEQAGERVVIERTAVRPDPDSPMMTATIGSAAESEGLAETDRRGIYEAWPVTSEGLADVRRIAVNVDPAEGDLSRVASQDLLAALEPVAVRYRHADQYDFDLVKLAGSNRSLALMLLLIGLLVAEQLLAYSASYHPKPVTAS